MTISALSRLWLSARSLAPEEAYYEDLRRKHVLRLCLTYLLPLILLTLYFFFQQAAIVSESERLHLKAIAENQANTLDLFLSERRVNLVNLINHPGLSYPPDSRILQTYLEDLKNMSETFVDLGYFDPYGVQAAYAGPYPALERRSYSEEAWYVELLRGNDDFIITDVYHGFRHKLHFTIAVKRMVEGKVLVLRSTLDPRRIYEYLSSLEGSREVFTSIVNKAGLYQVVTEHLGTPLETSSFVPTTDPPLGSENVRIQGSSMQYAYSWLRMAEWALIVQWSAPRSHGLLAGTSLMALSFVAAVILLILFVIFRRARRLAQLQRESNETRAQLEHAAKLASVGELAAGIAHEVNNPLAIISEEAGLIKDLMSPQFHDTATLKELLDHLDEIQASALRCRDVTAKLLAFVRKVDLDLKPNDVNELIDFVVDGLLSREFAVSNIEVQKRYGQDLPRPITDRNQLQQVLLNLLNNASDAIGDESGTITIETFSDGDAVRITIRDSGKGISPDNLKKIFMPFFTSKEVGRGTGLGLPVSCGIVQSLGGRIEVESAEGKGSTFILVLPLKRQTASAISRGEESLQSFRG